MPSRKTEMKDDDKCIHKTVGYVKLRQGLTGIDNSFSLDKTATSKAQDLHSVDMHERYDYFAP